MYRIKGPLKHHTIFFALLVSALLLLIPHHSVAQTQTSSPYSRYGVGDQTYKGFAKGFAMGGTSIAMQNDSSAMYFINSGNPASYSNMRLTVAELGVNFSRLQLESTGTKKTVNNGSVGYIALAFPFKKWWGASAGLVPYSAVGYKVSEKQNITNVGDVSFLYEGAGGINQVYFGNAIKPLYGLPDRFINSQKYRDLKADKKDSVINKILNRRRSLQSLSLGFNASYMFGSINLVQRSEFPGSSNAFNTRTGTTSRVGDVYFDYGAQYAFTFDSIKGRDIKDNVQLLLGATFATQTNITTKTDSLSYSYYYSASGYEISRDTISDKQNSKGTITLPAGFGFGLGFKKGNRWFISSDFAIQSWSNYKEQNLSQGLKDSWRVSVGLQYIPNSKANGKGNYSRRMNYRMGARYAQTAIELKNTPIIENAVSIGLGLPVGRNFLLQNFSMINISVEVGQRGSITNGLIKEQFFKAVLGFTINDKWFIKPKFD